MPPVNPVPVSTGPANDGSPAEKFDSKKGSKITVKKNVVKYVVIGCITVPLVFLLLLMSCIPFLERQTEAIKKENAEKQKRLDEENPPLEVNQKLVQAIKSGAIASSGLVPFEWTHGWKVKVDALKVEVKKYAPTPYDDFLADRRTDWSNATEEQLENEKERKTKQEASRKGQTPIIEWKIPNDKLSEASAIKKQMIQEFVNAVVVARISSPRKDFCTELADAMEMALESSPSSMKGSTLREIVYTSTKQSVLVNQAGNQERKDEGLLLAADLCICLPLELKKAGLISTISYSDIKSVFNQVIIELRYNNF